MRGFSRFQLAIDKKIAPSMIELLLNERIVCQAVN
jgi:hypothetical protein